MRQLIFFVLLLFLSVSHAAANEPAEVSKLIQERINAVMFLLQDKSLDKPSRNEKILEIVTPIFNYQTMSKLSLGKKHWPALSPEKQVEFSELFSERLQASYLEKLDIYTDEKILYGEPKEDGKKIYMPTTLISKDNKIEILYKLYKSSGNWKIYDVEVGGVSIIQTYRSQFDDALSNGTIDELLEKLKDNESFDLPVPEEAKG